MTNPGDKPLKNFLDLARARGIEPNSPDLKSIGDERGFSFFHDWFGRGATVFVVLKFFTEFRRDRIEFLGDVAPSIG